MQIVIAGQGYVGLPLAVRAAEVGHCVVGYDVDLHRVQQLAAGQSYVRDVDSSRLRAVLDSGAYTATADTAALASFDIAVITVPTPLRDGVPDLTYIESCARTLGEHLRPGATVVLESTSYPGTTDQLLLPILEEVSGLKARVDFLAGFSPERIGNKRWSFDTPKLVSGIDAKSLDVIKGFYDGIFQTTVPVSGTKVAELAKLLENTFRFVNISLINEMAMLAASLGVNIWEAIDAAATKPFGFTRFTPGPGVGGHCLPVDPMFLSWKAQQELGVPFRFAELAADVNRRMPDYVVRRLVEALDKRGMPVRGSRILLLGLTYTGSSLNPEVEINTVSGGDRVDQGLEVGGWVFV
ncbi:nucleotide sugar dehydrogenase, partial [Streptomyces sp. NPDC002778]